LLVADRHDCALLAVSVLGACGGTSPLIARQATADSGVEEAGAPTDADSGDAPALPPLQVRLDPSFGIEGSLDGDLARWTPVGVAIDPQGRIVVSGPGQTPDTPVAEVVRRFTPDGADDSTLDPSSNLGFDSYSWGQAARVLSNGTIAVLGAAAVDGGDGAFAFRLAADGSADPNFEGSPLLVSSVGSFSTGFWQDDGSGFLLGAAGVVRFDANGTLDPSYVLAGPAAPADAGALASDGRLWTATGSRVSRHLASGASDPSFGQGGSVDLSAVSAGAEVLSVQTLLLESTGAAFVLASNPDGDSFDVDVARITVSGGMDPDFADGRFVSVPANGAPTGAAQLSDGRIIIWTSYGDLIPIESGGVPESTSSLDVLGTVLAATLDMSQRLMVVGMITANPTNSRWFVRRYLLL
jgi:Domain of unknown function (DUF5122) beta-propeller